MINFAMFNPYKIMKKSIILLLLICSVVSAHSQTRLRANLLAYAAVVPNIGIETRLSNKLTGVVEGYFSPMWNQSDFKFKGYLVTPELRYYFCESFNKHYIGIHGNFGKLDDLKLLRKHNIRKDVTAIAVGVTYGHQWIFNHHWSLDVFGGIGWWRFKGDVYSKCDPSVMVAKDEVKNAFGPTRLGVTLGYRF